MDEINSIPMEPENTTENSDYRVSQTSQTTRSYSSVLNQPTTTFPSKKQAIIFPAIENLKLEDYLIALGNIIKPSNIIFSSRISNNRICIYLSKEEILDNFMNTNQGKIQIGEQVLQTRRLITPNVRLLISNVCPSIPHNIIETELQKLRIKLVSQINFIRIGTTNPEFKHILSFRRQAYIAPPERIEIPESIVLSHDQTSYRIFLSIEHICYRCKQTGHLATNCPTMELPNNEPIYRDNSLTNISTDMLSNSSLTKEPPKPVSPIKNIQQPLTSSKRLLSDIITPSIQTDDNTVNTKPNFTPKTTKKPKTSQPLEHPTPIEELMRPTKIMFDQEASSLPLTYQEISDFFENVYGSPDPLSVAKIYTPDIQGLLYTLNKIYPCFTDRKMKARCTKLQNKIKKQLDLEITSDSDSSQETHQN